MFGTRISTAVVVCTAAATSSVVADTINVPADAPTIQTAVNIASAGDTIIVAPGTYFESVAITKTLTINAAGGPEVTVLNAAAQLASAFTVSADNCSVHGLTITEADVNDLGGAFFIDKNIDFSATDCDLVDNVAEVSGGGVYVGAGAAVSFVDCNFSGNEALFPFGFPTGEGGAIYCEPQSSCTLLRCEFDGNVGGQSGGAIAFFGDNAVFTDCLFEDSIAGSQGGHLFQGSGTIVSDRCVWRGSKSLDGGPLHGTGGDLIIRNSLITGNTSIAPGGSIMKLGGSLEIEGSTIVGNDGIRSIHVSGGASVTVANSIIRNEQADGEFGGVNVTVRYSNILGGIDGEGNVDLPPVFVDPDRGDFRLSASSPLIDAGDSGQVAGDYPTDLGAQPRAVDAPNVADSGIPVLSLTVDIGAHEFQPDNTGASCNGDVNGNDVVGFEDIVLLLNAWGPCP